MKNKSIILIVVMAIFIIILAVCSVYILKNTKEKSYAYSNTNNSLDELANKSNNTDQNNISSGKNEKENLENKPYIPEGFTHVSGTDVETGYIIKDENGNEFVWIPVSTGILKRSRSNNQKYEDNDTTATGLVNSVSKYYGFYIARYESSKTNFKGTETVATIKGAMPWMNTNYDEAYEAAYSTGKSYGYSGVTTCLMNSYAWDTALAWINKSEAKYSTNTSYGNYSGTILKTGETEDDEVNSICDLAGNVREWTTENYYPELTSEDNENIDEDEEENIIYKVIRGGSASVKKSPNSHTGQNPTLSDTYWGFRIILYKDM